MRRRTGVKEAPSPTADELAKKSDVTVGGSAVPPQTEYFGFALYVGSIVLAAVYLMWAFVPKRWLEEVQIYYYPSRWWSVVLPSFLIVGVCYIYVALASYNVEVLTRPLDSLETITDSNAKVVSRGEAGRYLFSHSDGVWDLPLSEVCQVLYNQEAN